MANEDYAALVGEVSSLRGEVEDMSRTLSAMARTGAFRNNLAKAFARDPLLAQVFLMVGEHRTQSAISDALDSLGLAAHQTTISRKLRELDEDWDLIAVVARGKTGAEYVQTRLAKDLKIKRQLQSKGGMTPND